MTLLEKNVMDYADELVANNELIEVIYAFGNLKNICDCLHLADY